MRLKGKYPYTRIRVKSKPMKKTSEIPVNPMDKSEPYKGQKNRIPIQFTKATKIISEWKILR
jgi:hypothetical protein